MEVTFWEFIWSLLLGVLFGVALHKSGMTKYSTIVNVFRFRDLSVLKFMLATLITAMPLIYILKAFGVLSLTNINPTYIAGNLIGGLIFGVGMAVSGYCPGTMSAGTGQGSIDYLIPGLLGFIAGAYVFAKTYTFFTKISQIGNFGAITMPDLFHVNTALFIIAFIEVTLLLFYFLEKKGIK